MMRCHGYREGFRSASRGCLPAAIAARPEEIADRRGEERVAVTPGGEGEGCVGEVTRGERERGEDVAAGIQERQQSG